MEELEERIEKIESVLNKYFNKKLGKQHLYTDWETCYEELLKELEGEPKNLIRCGKCSHFTTDAVKEVGYGDCLYGSHKYGIHKLDWGCESFQEAVSK